MASRPFPLPKDLGVKHERPSVYLWRSAAAYLRAGANRSGRLTAEGAARQLFAGDTPTLALVQRAASVPATTTGTGWGDALIGRSVFDAVQDPTSLSASAALIASALHVDLTGAVVVPGRIVDATQAGAWVREAAAVPVHMLNFSSMTLEPRKLAVISCYTREMSESSNVENVVRQTLGEASGLALDAAMFSNAPGDDTRPAGLLNGVAPLVPAPAGPNAMAQDLGALINALAEHGAGLAPTFVAAPAQALAIKLFAGAHFDIPVLAAAIPNRTVVAIEASSLAVGSAPRVAAFQKGLSETGHVESQNVTVEYYWLDGRFDRLPSLMADLVRRRVAVIATPGQTAAAQAAKAATTTIPIVFGVDEDPVKLGLVSSLARPGANVTGINYFVQEVLAKRLGLLHELVPNAVRINVLVNPANAPVADVILRDVPEAARGLGVQIRVLNASTSREIEAAFATLEHDLPDALFIAPDGFFTGRTSQFVTLASRDRIPTSCGNREMVEAGLLMSYGTDNWDMFRRVGVYTGQILKGANPADLPVVQSTKFEFVINMQTARALGLEIPPTLLARADEVIE